jgi:DNA-binding MarR family transcriptional regulator
MKHGYVSQSPDPDDGRLVMLELTDAGRKATLSMKAVAAEVSRETLRPFTDEEAEQLLALLGRLGG